MLELYNNETKFDTIMVMLVKHWKVKNRIPMSLYSTPYTYRHRMVAVFNLQFASISHAHVIFEKKMCHCVKPDQVMRNAYPRKGSFWSDIESKLCEPIQHFESPEKVCNHAWSWRKFMHAHNYYMTLNNEWMKKKDRSKSRRLMRLTEMQCTIKEIHMKVEHSKWSTRSTAH